MKTAPTPGSTPDRIRLTDVQFHGHCGCTEAERELGQRLSLDLELEVSVAQAAATDDLSRTIDYVKLIDAIVDAGRRLKPALLETLAERLAQLVLERFHPNRVTIRLRKVAPPVEAIAGAFEVQITRPE
ncbi:MAG: dihydroneopterin aldolase [Nitrospirae bacterium]|nr:dihydroneopterin aldolase [Nitrospirota bacterium]